MPRDRQAIGLCTRCNHGTMTCTYINERTMRGVETTCYTNYCFEESPQ